MIEFQVEPRRSMVDEPLRILLSGLAPGQRVTVRAAQTDDSARTWRAHATFVADTNGLVDVAAQAPVSGTYSDADAMGLIWSMELAADEANQGPFFRNQPTPVPIEFVAEVDDARWRRQQSTGCTWQMALNAFRYAKRVWRGRCFYHPELVRIRWLSP